MSVLEGPVLGRPAQNPVLGFQRSPAPAQLSASAAQRQRRLSVLEVFCAGIPAQPSASAGFLCWGFSVLGSQRSPAPAQPSASAEIPSASAAIPSASAAQRQRRPSAGAGAVLVLGCAGARLCWDNLGLDL